LNQTATTSPLSSATRALTIARLRRGRRTVTERTSPAIAASSSASSSAIRRSGTAAS
jgi:hypothetical protein